MNGFTSRQMMDKAETLVNGAVDWNDGRSGRCLPRVVNVDNTPVLATRAAISTMSPPGIST